MDFSFNNLLNNKIYLIIILNKYKKNYFLKKFLIKIILYNMTFKYFIIIVILLLKIFALNTTYYKFCINYILINNNFHQYNELYQEQLKNIIYFHKLN